MLQTPDGEPSTFLIVMLFFISPLVIMAADVIIRDWVRQWKRRK